MQVVVVQGAGDKQAPDIKTSYIHGNQTALRNRGLAELYKTQKKRRFTLTLLPDDYRVGDSLKIQLNGETVKTMIVQVEHLFFDAKWLTRVVSEVVA